VADLGLAGRYFAPHYAKPLLKRCVADSAMVRETPSDKAVATSQLVLGEPFYILDESGGWAWGYCGNDHYVGYLPFGVLGDSPDPTHRTGTISAPIFSHADIKSPVARSLSLGSLVAAEAHSDDFWQVDEGFLHRRHICPLDAIHDHVTTANLLLGQPYLWGGRGAGGIDCSGLVQLALSFAGLPCPRDSDLQRTAIGGYLASSDELRRGDIVFFPGHVGIMADSEQLLHANAYWMAVTIEPLRDVVARAGGEAAILARKRIEEGQA
jgi:cell wall-associated NlpC family hydrolase